MAKILPEMDPTFYCLLLCCLVVGDRLPPGRTNFLVILVTPGTSTPLSPISTSSGSRPLTYVSSKGPSQRDWFSSMEFRSWVLGSVIAIAGMPTLTILMRSDPHKSEAWTFFAGGTGSLLITLWFLVVLYKFPRFLRRVRAEGAEAEVVVRLTTFDELNVSIHF